MCRRGNPVPYVSGVVNPESPYKIEYAAIWPRTKDDDWCGEWLANEPDIGDE